MELKSTLEVICKEVFTEKDLVKAKQIAIDHLSKTKVKDKDKMITEISQFKTTVAFQRYICNALLKFEGLGMAQLEKPKDIN